MPSRTSTARVQGQGEPRTYGHWDSASSRVYFITCIEASGVLQPKAKSWSECWSGGKRSAREGVRVQAAFGLARGPLVYIPRAL